MPSSSLSSVTSVTLKATSGVPPNVITHGTQTIDLAGLSVGPNSVEITHPGIKSALSSGNNINHSLQLEHGGLSVVETAGAPYPPPDYSVTNFQKFGGFVLDFQQKYTTYVGFRTSSVGGIYGHRVVYYPNTNPANKTIAGIFNAYGLMPSFVFSLEPSTSYTVAVTLVNMHTGEELTNLQPVQTITFTTPTLPLPPIANILSGLYTKVETTLNFAISVGYSPFREALALAFDDNNYTKYLNFNGAGSDVLIDATQNYLVTGLGLTTANDGPERDPTSFILYGSNTPFVITNFVNPDDFWAGGSNFASGGLPGQTLIASGSLNPPLERVTAYPNVTFNNNATRYRYYRLVFDSIRNLPYTANCLQISEIRLSGYL